MANMKSSFDFGSLDNFLRDRHGNEIESKKIANNTIVERLYVTNLDGNEETDAFEVYLHGHCIATIERQIVIISSCGYQTVTTKERLNHVLRDNNLPSLYQQNWVWYVGDMEFSDNMELSIATGTIANRADDITDEKTFMAYVRSFSCNAGYRDSVSDGNTIAQNWEQTAKHNRQFVINHLLFHWTAFYEVAEAHTGCDSLKVLAERISERYTGAMLESLIFEAIAR